MLDTEDRSSAIDLSAAKFYRISVVPKYNRATWSSHLYLSGTNIENVSLQSIELRWHKV